MKAFQIIISISVVAIEVVLTTILYSNPAKAMNIGDIVDVSVMVYSKQLPVQCKATTKEILESLKTNRTSKMFNKANYSMLQAGIQTAMTEERIKRRSAILHMFDTNKCLYKAIDNFNADVFDKEDFKALAEQTKKASEIYEKTCDAFGDL